MRKRTGTAARVACTRRERLTEACGVAGVTCAASQAFERTQQHVSGMDKTQSISGMLQPHKRGAATKVICTVLSERDSCHSTQCAKTQTKTQAQHHQRSKNMIAAKGLILHKLILCIPRFILAHKLLWDDDAANVTADPVLQLLRSKEQVPLPDERLR